MTEVQIISIAETKGHNIDLTLNDDCLYCSATDTNYLFSTFSEINELQYEENGVIKKLKLVTSSTYCLKGYYTI